MNEDQFEALMDRYMPYVVAVIVKVAGNRLGVADREEVASDVFVKLWEKRNELNIQNGKEKAYIGTCARNHTLNLLKKKGLLEMIPFEENQINSGQTTPEKTLLRQEEERIIRETVECLPAPDDEIFIRRYFYFEKIIDIAKAFNMKEQTVTTKLRRGKVKLEKLFKERGIEG